MLPRAVRPATLEDLTAVRALLDADPVVNVFVAARLDAALKRAGLNPHGLPVAPSIAAPRPTRSVAGIAAAPRSGVVERKVLLNRAWLGGELWCYAPAERVEALCFVGGNVVPVAAGAGAIDAFGEVLRKQPRWAASLVGPADAVLALWELVSPSWGRAREVRATQPLLAAEGPSLVPGDPRVRRRTSVDLDALFPASVAMFTEEVGVSPMGADGGAAYRARLREIVDAGHSLARIDDTPDGRRVMFKAEVGYATEAACQVQGVWVPLERRGEGLGVAGMAAVVDIARRDIAPIVSLYVNDYNEPAQAVYERVGFHRVGTFATVLL